MAGLHPIQPAPPTLKMKPSPSAQIDSLCEICGKNFTNQSQLKYHARSHMPIEQRRTFECYLCQTMFAYKKSLIPHMALHHSGAKTQFQCEICQLHFSRTDALRRHQLIHLNKLPHTCSYCEKGFRTKFNLKVKEQCSQFDSSLLWSLNERAKFERVELINNFPFQTRFTSVFTLGSDHTNADIVAIDLLMGPIWGSTLNKNTKI